MRAQTTVRAMALGIVALLPSCLARTVFIGTQAIPCGDGCTTIDNLASQLVFASQPPATAVALADFSQSPTVAVQDSSGSTVATSSVSVTLAAYMDAGCNVEASGTLSAAVNPVDASSGLAVYAGVSYSMADEPIFLKASSPGLTPACSSRITMLSLTRPFGTPTGKIVACGDFTTYRDTTLHTVGRGVVRVDANGALDQTFNSGNAGANSEVAGCMPEIGTNGIPTGKIIIAGSFTQYNGSFVPRGLIRLNQDGTWDSTFNQGSLVGFDNSARGQMLQELGPDGLPTGRILLTGGTPGFAYYNGSPAGQILRINTDGTRDTSFATGSGFGSGAQVYAIAQELSPATGLPTGNLVVGGGGFATFDGVPIPNGLVRLTTAGTLDTSFNVGGSGLNAGAEISSVLVAFSAAVLPTGKFLVTGTAPASWSYNGGSPSLANLLRINSDGTLDNTFSAGSGPDSDTRSLTWDVDASGFATGKTLVAGPSHLYNSLPIPIGVIRINADGTLDDTLNPGQRGYDIPAGTGGDLNRVVPLFGASGLPTGKLMTFGLNANTSFNGIANAASAYLSPLKSDGTLDASFNPHGAGAGIGGPSPALNMGFQERQ